MLAGGGAVGKGGWWQGWWLWLHKHSTEGDEENGWCDLRASGKEGVKLSWRSGRREAAVHYAKKAAAGWS